MKVTECLGIEHRVFLRQIDRLAEAQRRGAPPPERRAMVALLGEVLEEHARIEDEILFPALESHLGRQAGPLAVMDAEHEEIRHLLAEVAQGDDDVDAMVSRFIDLAREHFAKEDQVLFPLAEQLLGEERLTELAQACPHVQPLGRG